MNRREEPMTVRLKKKMKKTVRIAVETEGTPSPRNLRGQNPAKKPSKVVKQAAARLKSLQKSLGVKQKKALGTHKKRSTPGDVPSTESPPAYPHKEAKRWMQTVEKQTLDRSSRMMKKLGKKGYK